ncbi:hypothetical protein TNCV_3309731 [Trichonephila clavipes]|nr:hypothetical protein TNCV_3309731 [Trichonephila clavipes]
MDHKRVGRVEVLQAKCVYKRTDGSVIAGNSAVRARKSQSGGECRVMEVTRVEQRLYIKIAVLRGKNTMEYHLGSNALPYRTVAQWMYCVMCCHSFAP